MTHNLGIAFISIFALILFGCAVGTKHVQSPSETVQNGEANLGNDSTMIKFDLHNSGDGVYGRKVIFRDLSARKAAVNTSGRVVTKVCINRAGTVTYVELIPSETTISDKPTVKAFIKASRGYKFQPDLSAPDIQCGKLKFTVDNSVNNKLR